MSKKNGEPRYCKCGTKLSMYNDRDKCWPCQQRSFRESASRGFKPLSAGVMDQLTKNSFKRWRKERNGG